MNQKTKKSLGFILLLSMIGFSISFSKVPTGHECGSLAQNRICYQFDLTNPNDRHCKNVSYLSECGDWQPPIEKRRYR